MRERRMADGQDWGESRGEGRMDRRTEGVREGETEEEGIRVKSLKVGINFSRRLKNSFTKTEVTDDMLSLLST